MNVFIHRRSPRIYREELSLTGTPKLYRSIESTESAAQITAQLGTRFSDADSKGSLEEGARNQFVCVCVNGKATSHNRSKGSRCKSITADRRCTFFWSPTTITQTLKHSGLLSQESFACRCIEHEQDRLTRPACIGVGAFRTLTYSA